MTTTNWIKKKQASILRFDRVHERLSADEAGEGEVVLLLIACINDIFVVFIIVVIVAFVFFHFLSLSSLLFFKLLVLQTH